MGTLDDFGDQCHDVCGGAGLFIPGNGARQTRPDLGRDDVISFDGAPTIGWGFVISVLHHGGEARTARGQCGVPGRFFLKMIR